MRRSPVLIIAALEARMCPSAGPGLFAALPEWPKRRVPRERTARIMALVLAATLAACGFESVQPSAPPAVLVNNDPIPPPSDLEDELAGLPGAWGFRLDEIPAGTRPPRVSSARASEVAGEDFLATLQANRVPPQSVSPPDGLLRRLYVNPQEETRQTVWVVINRWDRGFNCNSPAGGPGPCESWTATFVDHETGEIVGGLSSTGG